MFCLYTLHKITVFHFHNPKGSEIREAVSRDTEIWQLISSYLTDLFQSRTMKIMDNESSCFEDELKKNGIRTLVPFFQRFPSAWQELKRKLSTHKSFTNKRWFISDLAEENVLSVFLRLWREDGLWTEIEESFRQEILANSKLIWSVSKEPSILDSSHGDISIIPAPQRRSFIEHMLRQWIQMNIDEPIRDINSHLKKFLPLVSKYLKSIFDISLPTGKEYSTIKWLSKYIAQEIWWEDKNWVKSKEAWTIVKAFSAWWWYADIERLRQETERNTTNLPDKLEWTWVNLTFTESSIENGAHHEPVTINKYQASIYIGNGTYIPCAVESRVKSMRSILLKLWENEDYNNIDAMRDLFWMAVIFPKDTSDIDKERAILTFTQVMSNKWYIIKNKWLLNDEGIKQLKSNIKNQDKKPLWKVVSKRKWKTHQKLENTSISGFTNIFWSPIGMEIQFYDEEGYNFWKRDHYTFDPLKVISAWSRGSWFITPKQLLYIIRREISDDVRDTVLRKLSQDIILDYIKAGNLLAYIWTKGEVYFTMPDHKENFEEKFRGSQQIDIHNSGFQDFIKNLTIRWKT